MFRQYNVHTKSNNLSTHQQAHTLQEQIKSSSCFSSGSLSDHHYQGLKNSIYSRGCMDERVTSARFLDFSKPNQLSMGVFTDGKSALTTLLKHQLKQSKRSDTTSMNDILKMVMMTGPIRLQESMFDNLETSAGISTNHQKIYNSEFNDKSQDLEMKQITDMSTSRDRSSLKGSVLSVLYQIIDEVLSDTNSSLPLCWSTSSYRGDGDQLIKRLSLKWESERHLHTSPIEQNLHNYLSKQSFLTNQELIDLMVNSHNLLEESNTMSDGTQCTINALQLDTHTTTEEILSHFPSAETFDAIFKSLGESTKNPRLVVSLNLNIDNETSLSQTEETPSNFSSPNNTPLISHSIHPPTLNENHSPTTEDSPNNSHTSNRAVDKKSTKRPKHKYTESDKNQLFGSFLLKTSSSFTKITKTRKSSKSTPTQMIEKQTVEPDSSLVFLNKVERPAHNIQKNSKLTRNKNCK